MTTTVPDFTYADNPILTTAQRTHYTIADHCHAVRTHDGAVGIAHLRPGGLVAFYPAWSARGLNYVCRVEELTLGSYCDKHGRVVPY